VVEVIRFGAREAAHQGKLSVEFGIVGDVIREAGHWAIDTIDEGIELLTGISAGNVDQEGTFHYLLDQRLQEILSVLQEQPAAGMAPRVRLAPWVAPKPSPPPLPGERE
jgi:hypothetical protein